MKTTINLLPRSYQRSLVLRRRAIQWGIVIGITFVVGAAVRWTDVRERRALEQSYELLEREHRPTQRMLEQLVDMRQQLAELEELEQTAQELDAQRPVLAVLGCLSRIAEKTGGRLRITKLEMTGLQQVGGANSVGDARAGGLLLTGVSLDYPAIAELLSGLQDSELFARVELLKSTEQTGEASSLFDYQVRCDFAM